MFLHPSGRKNTPPLHTRDFSESNSLYQRSEDVFLVSFFSPNGPNNWVDMRAFVLPRPLSWTISQARTRPLDLSLGPSACIHTLADWWKNSIRVSHGFFIVALPSMLSYHGHWLDILTYSFSMPVLIIAPHFFLHPIVSSNYFQLPILFLSTHVLS